LKKSFFWIVYGILLGVVTLAGLELIAFILTPAWPAYELRPIAVPTNLVRQVEVADGSHKTIPFYNSWGMKDRERSFDRPPDIRFRTVFNGDSFLEGMFRLEPLSHVVERDWARAGRHDMEAINLGISATNPIHYYYRISNVVVKLHPDAMLLMFYPGNDFTSQTYSPDRSLPFVAERPKPSVLGGVAPHLTWQIVNRLGLSEIAGGNTSAPDEYNIMLDIMKKPRKDRVEPLAAYLRQYYLPNVSEAQIEEILSRNGGSFWEPFERKDETAEQLAGWIPASIIRFETGETKTPATAAEAERTIDPAEVESTLSWLIAAKKLAEANHIKLLIAVAPMGSVDPSYVEFWKPWPRFYGWSVRQTVERGLLLDALQRRGISAIDLAQDLDGIRGTYRLTDGHWTARGTSVVAKRVAHELARVRDERAAGKRPTAD
jgi:hypothetical protein